MIRRGSVYWFDPDPSRGSEQSGRRPAIVVSRNSVNHSSPVVIVVPLTTFRSQVLYPSDVKVEPPDGGVKVPSVAVGLQVRAIDKTRLTERLGELTPATLHLLERALLDVLDITPRHFIQ